MDFAYSPHREGGGTMHLPSPTHHHGYTLENLSSIQQLRRSLSRSPSKPSRFQLRKSDSPGSPISPLALARAFSPKPHNKDHSPISTFPESLLPVQTPVQPTKKRFTLRRSAPFRSSPRTRNMSKSPRRALADSTDQGNATPFASRRISGEENMTTQRTSTEHPEKVGTEMRPVKRFDLDDKPIKFDPRRSRQDLAAPGAPAKSSPLKRSDGIMSLDTTGMGSPAAKRRSLHGMSTLGADFDIFDHAPSPRTSDEETRRPHDVETNNIFSFSSPISKTDSPLRKTSSLRKSTLSQRLGANNTRPKPTHDGEFVLPGQAASKTRQRMSLDSSLGFVSSSNQPPFRLSSNADPTHAPSLPFLRASSGAHQPHPLSNALTPSSSTSSMEEDAPTHAPVPPTAAPPRGHPFARSLPIGPARPLAPQFTDGESVETPMAFKMAKPNPAAFQSTGLLTKKHRNVQELKDTMYIMPGTPSKRNSFPPVTSSPSLDRRNHTLEFGKLSRPEFGQPSTPFSVHKPSSSASFGQGVGIFGSFGSNHQRRSSFASIDGDDISHSPCGKLMTDSQSSADDMPPTPTKQNEGAGRRSKDSSLRRKTFRQQRASLGTDTFSGPDDETPSIDIPAPPRTSKYSFCASSPHTPNESFIPPDPSKLSISGQRRSSVPFNCSTNSNPFPPATPTTPRDHSNYFAHGQAVVAPIALTQNDVDVSLAQRFRTIAKFGNGEFSTVYRVENPVDSRLGFDSPPASRVWAVKKTAKPYLGNVDRQKKMAEVHILQALRGHEHIVYLEDHWEYRGHLYIQTEFCEEGNLNDFLVTAGDKSRLDDFRIWKILLELSSGVKYIHENGYIHLDLKPANVLITFDGVLKIADFGLASPWPAGRDIDGEGDRHYLAPEALRGRYDKPCDVYALGAIMVEIGGNIILPENGTSWQRLRTGDFSELPSLTWSSNSSLFRDMNGVPLCDPEEDANESTERISSSDGEDVSFKQMAIPSVPSYPGGLITPPRFMIDPIDFDSLHQLAQWMMHPDPDQRPTVDQVYGSYGCQWVERRARAGATIFEGNWGPADDVLHHNIHETDIMDIS